MSDTVAMKSPGASLNKSIKQSSGWDDKILVITCVTIIAVLSLVLAGGVIWIFKDNVGETSGLVQSILSVVMSIVTGLMGIAVGRGLPKSSKYIGEEE
jgi:hypothetical protein